MNILKTALIIFGLLLSTTTAATDGLPSEFQGLYYLKSGKTKVGEMQRQLKILNNGQYQFLSESRTSGIVAVFHKDHILEQTTWTVHEDSLKPIAYYYHRKKKNKERTVNIHFDWDAYTIKTEVNGSPWQMKLEDPVYDKLLYQIAIMRDLELGNLTRKYQIADGGKIKYYEFERLDNETINTPIGQFDTVKLIRHKSNSKTKAILWCAPQLNYLPIKVETIEEDGKSITAMIQSLTGLGWDPNQPGLALDQP